MNKKLSLVVPTYNSSSYVLDALKYPLKEDRINEIIISDDASSDYKDLVAELQEISPKIKMHKNKKNLGAFRNKIKAVSYCKNDWAILLDSDNSLTKRYIDRLFQIDSWNPNVIYCPDFARPKFNFKEFSGLTITSNIINKLIKENKLFFKALLNTGNYLVNVKKYQSIKFDQKFVGLIHAADVIFFNYHWLKNNGKLHVVRDLEYNHRLGHKSYFVRKATVSKILVSEIEKSWKSQKDLPSFISLKLKMHFAYIKRKLLKVKILIKKSLKNILP